MFEIKDQLDYDNWKSVSQSPMHQEIFNFTERWIALINERLSEGLANIVYDCRSEAGYSDITDYMFNCVLGVVSICYTNGEDICRLFEN